MILFALFLFACVSSDLEPASSLAVGERQMSLVYTGSVHGEIEPCG